MNLPDAISLENRIFTVTPAGFNNLALEIFRFQYQNCPVYQKYSQLMHCNPSVVNDITQIPFLPISFFKTQQIKTTDFTEEAVFESSGTTGVNPSRHYVKSLKQYERSFSGGFHHFYGNIKNYCLLAIMPSYMENANSSLVYMTEWLIRQTGNALSGFYLDNDDKLHQTILHNELKEVPTLLLGVTYALLDFALKYPMKLKYTIVMETGGMKGRKKEIPRQEVHAVLKQQLQLEEIHSEYGMTELLSQSYSMHNGIFSTAPTMKVLIREEDDPKNIMENSSITGGPASGAINIIDLCNLYSCSFIATDDTGKLYRNGSFEVLGRLDSSDIRGCSLLAI